jgi:hypothetical protein
MGVNLHLQLEQTQEPSRRLPLKNTVFEFEHRWLARDGGGNGCS